MGKKIILAENLHGAGGMIKFKIRRRGKIIIGYIYDHPFMSTFQGTEIRFYPEHSLDKNDYIVLGQTYWATYSDDYNKFTQKIIKEYKIEKL